MAAHSHCLTRGTEDNNEILFIRFPVMEIAAALSRSPQTCKRSLNELEPAGMIMHVRQGIGENAIRKLEKIPEPECSQFVAATKARFLAERDNSIRQRLAAAKLQEPIMQGHDLSGKERFHPETRYMITLEVQKDCFVGFKGERFLFYLSDEGKAQRT